MSYIVTIVGRTNVGKSTLFNRLLGKRQAILSPIAGTTRDFIHGEVDWQGFNFTAVDTAGVEADKTKPLVREMKKQIEVALEEANAVIFVVDAKVGLQALDLDIAEMLRKKKSRVPVILAANKYDTNIAESHTNEFARLGLGAPHTISANTGRGVGDMLDDLEKELKKLPKKKTVKTPKEDLVTTLAILGRPNVGKSTLFNKLAGKDRSIVSDMPGTTRDSINEIIVFNDKKYEFVDTAGLRRRGKIEPGVEKFSALRSLRALRYADIALILIEAQEGINAQDKHVIEFALKENKGIILVVNKWDLVEKDHSTLFEYKRYLMREFNFAKWIPMVFVSALTGLRVDDIYQLVDHVAENRAKIIPTKKLNQLIESAYMKQAPRGRISGKIYYAKQLEIHPPTFELVTSKPLHRTYLRYLDNQLRESVDFSGTPIVFTTVQRRD